MKKIIILFLLFMVCLDAFPQEKNKHLIYVSTDLLKLSTNAWTKRYKYNSEIDVRVLFFRKAGLYFASGMMDRRLKRNPIDRNLFDYRSKGYYFNAGLTFQTDNHPSTVTFSLGFIHSHYSETGTFIIEGNYWQDKLTRPLSLKNFNQNALYAEIGLRPPNIRKSMLGFYFALGSALGNYISNYTEESFAKANSIDLKFYNGHSIPGILQRSLLGPVRIKLNLCYQIL